MSDSYVDTILLEANRKSSAEYRAGNETEPSIWTNNLGSGIKLDIGDTISIDSAYISEIGNESSTIEIMGRHAIDNLGNGQQFLTTNTEKSKIYNSPDNGSGIFKKTDGNVEWTFTASSTLKDIRDDTINLTHSYYKNNQGDYYITLPRTSNSKDQRNYQDASLPFFEYNSSRNGSCFGVNPYRLGSDYSTIEYHGQAPGWGYSTLTTGFASRTEIINDGSRFTLFTRDKIRNYAQEGVPTSFALQGERDPALMNFQWFKKTVEYKITNGFNSPSNVASQFTETLSGAQNLQNFSYSVDNASEASLGQVKQNNFNVTTESNTFELLPCATGWFIDSQAKNWYENNLDELQILMYKTDYRTNAFSNNASYIFNAYQNTFAFGVSGNDFFNSSGLVPGMVVKSVSASNASQIDVPGFELLVGSTVTYVNFPPKMTGSSLAGSQDRTQVAFTAPINSSGEQTTLGEIYFTFTKEKLLPYYESSFGTVGYKRPEIQQTGRDITPYDQYTINRGENYTRDNSFLTGKMSYPLSATQASGSPTEMIPTNIPWTTDNLNKLKAFFESQNNYPELFDYNAMSASQKELINTSGDTIPGANVSPDNMRFIHMNVRQATIPLKVTTITAYVIDPIYGVYIEVANASDIVQGMIICKNTTGPFPLIFPLNTFITKVDGAKIYLSWTSTDTDPDEIIGSNITFSNIQLGDDRYFDDGTFSAGGLFFDYNESRKDIIEGEGSQNPVYDSLTYGFAQKYTHDSSPFFYIGLSVSKYQSGTIPSKWWDSSDEGPFLDLYKVAIGFDKHFNAYGTAAILLTNGMCGPWGGNYNEETLLQTKTTGEAPSIQTYAIYGGKMDLFDQDVAPGGTYPSYIGGLKTFQKQPSLDGSYLIQAKGDLLEDAPYGPAESANPYWGILNNEIYVGANQPSLQFDSRSSRFEFTYLHSPEVLGTNAFEIQANASVDTTTINNPVIKLNKRLSRLTYSSTFIPYNNVFKIAEQEVSGSNVVLGQTNADPMLDENIIPFSIMDAQTGVCFEEYGVDQKYWNQSLWELLGYSYEQFHQTKDNRQVRFGSLPITTSTPSTNGLLNVNDLTNVRRINAGGDTFTIGSSLEVVTPDWLFGGNEIFPAGQNSSSVRQISSYSTCPGQISYPPVSQNTTSTNITAQNLPRKMLSPVYLIKSDLLNPMFIGGREGTSVLPVMGIVNKENGYGDFYFGAQESTIFTNTIPRTIQNIRTSICEADGSQSRVDDGSLVIYKIQKVIKSNANVLENMINPPKSPPK